MPKFSSTLELELELNVSPDTNLRFPYDGGLREVTTKSALTKTSRIETQDLLLGDQLNVERIIEIGPSKVLSTMAQKTLNRKFLSQDKSRAVKRHLLSQSNDAQAIYFQYDDTEESGEQQAASEQQDKSQAPNGVVPTAATVPPPIQSKEEPKLPTPPVQSGPPQKTVEDEPLSAIHVAPALIAQKLKQPMDELNNSKSLKELSLGTV